jgi:hypothetical protein
MVCRNPSLGFVTKARVCKVMAKKETHDSHLVFRGMQKSVRAWTLALPSEFSFWVLESQMDSRIFKGRLQGSKPISLKSYLYHWKDIET